MTNRPDAESTVFQIKKEDYGSESSKMLESALYFLLLLTFWVCCSGILEWLFSDSRSTRPVYGSDAWLVKSIVVGIVWASFMSFKDYGSRYEEYELEIRPDELVKHGRKLSIIDHRTIHSFREVRRFGKVRGIRITSRVGRGLFDAAESTLIPAQHPQYDQIKHRLELWHSSVVQHQQLGASCDSRP